MNFQYNYIIYQTQISNRGHLIILSNLLIHKTINIPKQLLSIKATKPANPAKPPSSLHYPFH